MPEQTAEDSEELKGKFNPFQALSQGIDKTRERLLLGSLTNSRKYKVDGMVKKVEPIYSHSNPRSHIPLSRPSPSQLVEFPSTSFHTIKSLTSKTADCEHRPLFLSLRL